MNYFIKIQAVACLLLASAACHGQTPTSPTPIPSPGVTPPPPPVAAAPRTARTRYLAFGDSITAGTTSPALSLWRPASAGLPQSYPFKLQELLRARYRDQTIEITNDGRPGEAAADASRRFAASLTTVQPEVVILLHGVNDVTFQRVTEVRRTAEAIDGMAREARLRGSEVIICTMLPQRAGGLRAADPEVIAAYNAALREVARGENAMLIDFQAIGFDLRLIGSDGLHPTEEGYARMAEIFFNHARAWYEQDP